MFEPLDRVFIEQMALMKERALDGLKAECSKEDRSESNHFQSSGAAIYIYKALISRHCNFKIALSGVNDLAKFTKRFPAKRNIGPVGPWHLLGDDDPQIHLGFGIDTT